MADSTVQFFFSSWFGIKSAVQNVEWTHNWRRVSSCELQKAFRYLDLPFAWKKIVCVFFHPKNPTKRQTFLYISRRSRYYIYIYIYYTYMNEFYCFLTTNPPWKKKIPASFKIGFCLGSNDAICWAFRIPPWYLGILGWIPGNLWPGFVCFTGSGNSMWCTWNATKMSNVPSVYCKCWHL